MPDIRKAITASQKQYSVLSQHPKFGLVNKPGDTLYNQLLELQNFINYYSAK